MLQNYTNSTAWDRFQEIIRHPERVPFRFRYQGKDYRGFPHDHFAPVSQTAEAHGARQDWFLRFLFDECLTVTLKLSFYQSHGVAEWTVWFENTGDHDSGILEELQAELHIPGERPVLKGILGDHANQYQPYAFDLLARPVRFSADTGRATHIDFPYFNLECGDGGVMLAIGWAGTWSAAFEANGARTLCTLSAVNHAKTRLRPGETIRSALFVAAPYARRDENYAANYWRSWFIHCNLPPADASGNAPAPFSTCCLSSDTGLPNSDGSISERHTTWRPSLEKMLAEGAKVDFRWFDAGWYIAPDGGSPVSDWWGTVGTWTLDPVKWPGKTFLESTDFARAHGMKTLMWFEPERVTDPESLAQHYGYDTSWAIRREHTPVISNNIGNPDCLRWTTERICKTLRENRVEMYREDNNSDQASLWRYLDSQEGEDRRGITEYKFIMAHYKMWDDIIACTLSYGGCGFVDSCASGGGRNDLESLRRGIPLMRSDADRTSTSLRLSMTTAFNNWIPFCGASTKETLNELDVPGESDVYIWRASYLPVLNIAHQFVQSPTQDFSDLRRGMSEWKQVAPYLLKDFYVHTPWHSEHDRSSFTAFSFYDGEADKGVLLAFRMEACAQDALTIRLPYAEAGRRCRLTDQDTGEVVEIAAGQNGCDCTLHFSSPRQARLIWVEVV